MSMAAGYDENVLENPFFKALKGKYHPIFEDASARRLTICVPRYGSLGRTVPTLNDIENHILITLPGTEKSFETLNKREVIVDGHLLRTSSGFHDVRQVEILFEETFFNANKESFSILCIERPLEGGTGATTNALGPLESIQDCIEFLWPPYDGPYTSKQNVDQYLEFYQSSWSVEFSHLGTLMGNVITVLNKLFPMVMKETHLRKAAKSGNFTETIKLALETYALHKLHEKLFPAICSLNSQKDAGFNKVVRNLADIQLKDLGIKPALRQNIPAARRALSNLNRYASPLEKFNCLKQTIVGVTTAKETKGEEDKVLAVTADDLLPVLECLVIKSELPNWMANLAYLHNFRFSNRTYDEFRFYMSSFEAAVEYIRKSHHMDRRLDVSLKPKFLDSSDISSTIQEHLTAGSTQEEKSDPRVPGPSPLELFFQHVTNCHDSEVKRVLNSSSTRVKLCHPLCSCDHCEKVLDRHRNDPEAITAFSRDDLGRTALHMAADYGHTSTVHLLVQKGCVVNTTDYHGSTPLHLACQRGHQQATMLLLHYDADILAQDNDGNTPLHLCCSNGHEECAKALVYFDLHNDDLDVDAVNKHGDTPLHLAARWGFENIVKLLLDNGASCHIINKKDEKPLNCAYNLQIKRLLGSANDSQYVVIPDTITEARVRPVSSTDIDKTRKIDSNQSQIEGFLKTVSEGDIRMVYHKLGIDDEWDEDDGSSQSPRFSAPSLCHPLCQCEKCGKYQNDVIPSPYRKVDINSRGLDGKTALHLSSLYGFEHITNVLLKHGANPNIANYNRKCTPLHMACQYNHAKVVSILLRHHADVDSQDIRWNTPLHYCCQNGNIEPAKILIKNGATLNIANERGNTPLHDAARWSCIDIVHLLLENDAPLDIRNVQGLTPLQLAKHDDIVKVLNEGSNHDVGSEKSYENEELTAPANDWRQSTNEAATPVDKDFTSASSLSQSEERSDIFPSTSGNETFSRADHSTPARDHDSVPSSSFFDRESPELFASSSMASSLPQPTSDAPFPRKLPEISSIKGNEGTDHRAIAIQSLQELLEGIKIFDRRASLRKTKTIDRSEPLTSPLLKLQFSIRHYDTSRLRKVSNRTELERNSGGTEIDCDTTQSVEDRTNLDDAVEESPGTKGV